MFFGDQLHEPDDMSRVAAEQPGGLRQNRPCCHEWKLQARKRRRASLVLRITSIEQRNERTGIDKNRGAQLFAKPSMCALLVLRSPLPVSMQPMSPAC